MAVRAVRFAVRAVRCGSVRRGSVPAVRFGSTGFLYSGYRGAAATCLAWQGGFSFTTKPSSARSRQLPSSQRRRKLLLSISYMTKHFKTSSQALRRLPGHEARDLSNTCWRPGVVRLGSMLVPRCYIVATSLREAKVGCPGSPRPAATGKGC